MYLYLFLLLSGSLSEEAPPPPRGLAMGHLASRSSNPMAMARSLPVSVPVWGYRNNHAHQGDSHSGERVSHTALHACPHLHTLLLCFFFVLFFVVVILFF